MKRGRIAPAASPVGLAHADTPLGRFNIACSEAGVLAISLPGEEPAIFNLRVGAGLAAEGGRASDLAQQTANELAAYFVGQLQQFAVPLDARGTAFQRNVWDMVRAVPYGSLSSYGAIARQLGRPRAARAVGHANGSNPIPIIIPCHRLVGHDGSLTGYAGGLDMKRWLVDHERQHAPPATD